MKKIILIGGAPTVGKSTNARLLSDDLNIPWISTDFIRDFMKQIVNRSDYPNLFSLEDENKAQVTAEEYLSTHTAQEILDGQNSESEDVWKGVIAFIEQNNREWHYIIEGVAIIPKLVASYKNSDVELFPIFMTDFNKERIREVVYTRGLWDDAHTYSDDVKPKEVEWALLFSKYIQEEARKYDLISHEVGDRDVLTKKLINDLRNWLK